MSKKNLQKSTTRLIKNKRLNFSLSEDLYEKVRKEAYTKKDVMGGVVIVALEKYFKQ